MMPVVIGDVGVYSFVVRLVFESIGYFANMRTWRAGERQKPLDRSFFEDRWFCVPPRICLSESWGREFVPQRAFGTQ
jgi:hypothetical protein